MVRFRRQPGSPASVLLIALTAISALGCGENVLVTSWELSLKASDAGADDDTTDGPDAGFRNLQAISAQRARIHARKEADKDNHASDEKSGH